MKLSHRHLIIPSSSIPLLCLLVCPPRYIRRRHDDHYSLICNSSTAPLTKHLGTDRCPDSLHGSRVLSQIPSLD